MYPNKPEWETARKALEAVSGSKPKGDVDLRKEVPSPTKAAILSARQGIEAAAMPLGGLPPPGMTPMPGPHQMTDNSVNQPMPPYSNMNPQEQSPNSYNSNNNYYYNNNSCNMYPPYNYGQ